MQKTRVTVQNFKEDKYYEKICRKIGDALYFKSEFTTIDIIKLMGIIKKEDIEQWKSGKIDYLERKIQGSLSKLERIIRIIRMHSHDLKLERKEIDYKLGKKELRFSKTGKKEIEELYKSQYSIIGDRKTFLENKKELLKSEK